MKKTMFTIFIVALIIFVIDWGVMGVKLLDHNYEVMTETYIGLLCWIIMIGCALYKSFSNKCLHCGKLRLINGDYCSYCGKKIQND